jgi:hypothetical protein
MSESTHHGRAAQRIRVAAGAVTVAVTLTGAGAALAAATAAPTQAVPCSQSGLQIALRHPGTYAFRAACTLRLTRPLTQINGSVVLDGAGHRVALEGSSTLTGSIFAISGHSRFTLAGVTVADNTVTGFHGASGGDGMGFQNTHSGAHGEAGSDGFLGESAEGAGLNAGAGTTVLLEDDTFARLSAVGGAGGDGGDGGAGDSGMTASAGGFGGDGGAGGAGGDALGGAINSAGQLVVVGASFSDDVAIAGAGGNGGPGGAGGAGGAPTTGAGAGGAGGSGGSGGGGGLGGAGHGGAIYSSGVLSVRGTSFRSDGARGGAGGNGNHGGNGAVGGTTSAAGGVGGGGGSGASGGSAGGGAVDAAGRGVLAGVRYAGDAVAGGAVGPDCPSSGVGCGASGGAGAANSGLLPTGATGTSGVLGSATGPNAVVRIGAFVAFRITTATLPATALARRYGVQLSASGAVTPYVWSVRGLPRGLGPTRAGLIAGRATQAGTFHVTVEVRDPDAARPVTVGKRLTLVVR